MNDLAPGRKHLVRQAGREPQSRVISVALLVSAALGLLSTLVGCGLSKPLPNPPANKLNIEVSVFDHESDSHTPSSTTFLAITLTQFTSGGLLPSSETVEGTDAKTLECDGVSMQLVTSTVLSTERNQGSYVGSVPPQRGAYVCTYFWEQRAQQATLTIPVEIPTSPRIQSPASRATVPVPAPGERGIALSYANSGSSGARVVAAADDFNKRAASSDTGSDNGIVTIDSQKFPQAFSVGWGTLSLTRSMGAVDISNVQTNTAFASVRITTYEQLDQIPVFWV